MKNLKLYNKKINIQILQLKYQKNQIRNNIKIGNVLYIKYLLIKNNEILINSFIGLCLEKKEKSNYLVLRNTIKKETIKIKLSLESPLIIMIKQLKKYKKKNKLKKLK